MSFVHLSVRSDMSGTARSSIQDYVGAGKVEEYVKKAAELGQPAIAVTDLGTMRSVYALKKACDKHDIKPIYGVEVYVCLDHTKKNVSKELSEEICKNLPPSKWREAVDQYALDNGHMRGERDLATLTLWAGTDEGLRNLFKLTSKSWVDGFFYKPRVDVSMLREFSEGVFCGTAGPNSWIHKPNLGGRRREAIDRFKELSDIFPERLVLEIRPHQLLEQQTCNEFCFELASNYEAKIIATQGVHYVDQDGLAAQKMLCAIGTGKGSELSSCGLEIDSYWLKSKEEMLEALTACGSLMGDLTAEVLCLQTEQFAAGLQADFKLDPFAMIIPDIDTGDLSHVQFLKVRTSASERWASIPQEEWPTYRDRLVEELEELAKPVSPDSEATFASYIVYVNEVISMCRELGIALGPGRGSAAGSIVNWLLGITDVDPVEHGLMFSRFIAPNRIGPPDVDIDVDPSKRPLLFEKMKERWGEDCVAQISTFGKLKGRVVTNDVCRELKIPIPEVSKVTKHIQQKSDFEDGAFETVKEAFVEYDFEFGDEDDLDGGYNPDAHYERNPISQDCKDFVQKYPEFLPYALDLEGKMRNLGVHPAGIVCAPRPLSEFIPLETRKGKDDERVVVTAFDMQGVEQCGLLKIDMLGLITVNVIANALDKINEGREEPLTMSNIPLDDTETLKAFEERDFVGVFQFDSASAKKLCKGVTFPSFGTISDMTALNRPGPLDSGMAEQYIARKADPTLIEVDYCEGVSRITEETLGVMIYQEQVMQVCGEVGLHENPDTMRKIIGKKLMDKIEAEREGFVAGAAKSSPDMDNKTANKLYDDIVTFGRYGFNKSHSVAYAKIGYLCQYLKIHYPLEFFWAMMLSASENGKNDKLRRYAKEAKARGLKVLPPNVSKSGFELGIDREQQAIIGALNDVKKVGDKAAKSIVANQPFESFEDFISRVNRRSVNMGCIVALAHAGALDDLLDNVKQFVENAEFLFKESKLKRFNGWAETIRSFEGPDYTLDEKLFWRSEVNPMALDNPYASMLEKMSFEVREFEAKEFMEDLDKETLWVSGTLRNIKIYQDTGFGDRSLSDLEKEHESYGKEYAVGSIESDSGKSLKIKIPPHVYEIFKEDTESDEPVLVNVRVDNTYSTLRANVVLSLKKLKTTPSKERSVVQSIAFKHPVLKMKFLNSEEKAYARKDIRSMKSLLRDGHINTLPLVGLVVSIRKKLAGKKLTEMAWLGIVTPDGEFSEVTIFSSDWLGQSWKGREKPEMRGTFGVGSLISIDCGGNEFNGRFSLQYNGGIMKVLA